MPRLRASAKYLNSLFTSRYVFFCYSLHVNSFARVLSQLHVGVGLVQEIDDLLIVNLEETTSYYEINSHFSFLLNAIKQKFHGSWHQSFILLKILAFQRRSHHRVSLSGSSLPIRKDSAIVPFQAIQCALPS